MSAATGAPALLLVGAGDCYAEAARIAGDLGAACRLCVAIDAALAAVDHAAPDLILADVELDIAVLLTRLAGRVPVIGCGIAAPAVRAAAAIRLGALDYIPLPPDAALIAAALAAATQPQHLPVEHLVGHTVAEVERALIMHTLARARGNRTSASSILGISVRTMRNKLRAFGIEAGDNLDAW